MIKNTKTSGVLKTRTVLRSVQKKMVSHQFLLEKLHPEDIKLALDLKWIFFAPANGMHVIDHAAVG